MNRLAVALVFTLFIAGCSGGGGNSSTEPGPKPVPDVPTPGPKAEPKWGDLSCQKQKNCTNEILLLSAEELVDFFIDDLSNRVAPVAASPEELVFFCARHVGRAWDETFGERIDPPLDLLTDFLLAMVDPYTCTVKDDLRVQFEIYFQNTEEYKNEVHKN